MFITKIRVVLFLTLSFVATTACQSADTNLQTSTTQLAKTTADHAHEALCSAARGADYLFYPVLCTIAGKYFYNATIKSHAYNAPQSITDLEASIPGANTARNVLMYAVVGSLLCATLNYVSNTEPVNDFIQTNMPHFSALLQHLKTELSGDVSSLNPLK